MEKLIVKSRRKVINVDDNFVRSAIDEVKWDYRLTGIQGARGCGKTTLLLQYIKRAYGDSDDALYVSLDDIWFAKNSLSDLVMQFVQFGGKHIFLDEVHKYPDWSQELKNIYDDYPELKVSFTGSSLLEIINSKADLSRRAVIFDMQGLSFREYLNLEIGTNFPIFSLEEILRNHVSIISLVLDKVRPLAHFLEYLEYGYYPYYLESKELYHQRIEEVINVVTEVEIPLIKGIDISYSRKLKQLLGIISESIPFVPNISKLSERIGINRNTLILYLQYLSDADITKNIYKNSKGISRLQKPEKILLENTNLAYALSSSVPSVGTLRESYFANQLSFKHQIEYGGEADFIIDNNILVEVGGRNKTSKQLQDWDESLRFIAADGIEYGIKNKVPLWLFGFLY